MYVSGVSAGDNSPQTLRVEALSLSNSPTTSVSLASLNLTFDEDIQFEVTRLVDLCTHSSAGSRGGCAHVESADGSFAVHPMTSESVSWGYLECWGWTRNRIRTKLNNFLLLQRQYWIPAANPSWVWRAVTSSLQWRNKLSFRMVLGPSLQVRQGLRLPLWSCSLSPCSLLAEMLRSGQRFCAARAC